MIIRKSILLALLNFTIINYYANQCDGFAFGDVAELFKQIPTFKYLAIHPMGGFDESLLIATPAQLLERAGFKYETFDVTTDDGYILEVTRVINPLARKLRKIPVLLMCPLFATGAVYLISSIDNHYPIRPIVDRTSEKIQYNDEPQSPISNSSISTDDQDNYIFWKKKWPKRPKTTKPPIPTRPSTRSLALALSNAGFDVYLSCNRGSRERNFRIDPNIASKEIKDNPYLYTLDDIAKYDIDAMVNGVLNRTQSEQLHFIGYSQSTLLMFFRLSSNYPRSNENKDTFHEKIRTFVALTPVSGRNSRKQHFLKILVARLDKLIGHLLYDTSVFRPDYSKTSALLTMTLYYADPLLRFLIHFLISTILGPSIKTRLEPAQLGHLIQNGHGNQMIQLARMIRKDTPMKFDYGKEKNMQKYGQVKPPIYDYTKIRSKMRKSIVFICAKNDWIAPMDTVDWLKKKIGQSLLVDKRIVGYNHADMVTAYDNAEFVNDPIVKLLKQR